MKFRPNNVKSLNTKLSSWSMTGLTSFASGFQKWYLFWWTTIRNAIKSHFKNTKMFCQPFSETPALKSIFSLQDVLKIRNRLVLKPLVVCVVCVLLISVTFRTELTTLPRCKIKYLRRGSKELLLITLLSLLLATLVASIIATKQLTWTLLAPRRLLGAR